MQLLGSRLRQRRKWLRLRQGDVAGKASASFLSKVENGAASPSLSNLRDWSQRLNTSTAELIGDHLVLEAAKECILLTEKCHGYLDHLPPSPTTLFLRDLSSSATALSVPVPKPPADPELEYLTAKVLLHRGEVQKAQNMAEKALERTYSPFLRVRYFSLLCLIYAELAETGKRKKCIEDLCATISELDQQTLLHTLPDADALSTNDLDLLKLSHFLKDINQI